MENYQTRLDYVQLVKFYIIDCIMKNNDADLEDLILKLLISAQPEEREVQSHE